MSRDGFNMRLWYPRTTAPAARAPLPAGGVALSREVFGGEELTLSREANAHRVQGASPSHLELFANPRASTPLLLVAGWHFRDFQEGLATEDCEWPVRPQELTKPRHLVAGDDGALGLFRGVASDPASLPVYLVPLPATKLVEAGQRVRVEPPFTVVVGEAAAEFVGGSTLAPAEAPTLRGPLSVDVGVLTARLATPERLDDAVLRHCLAAPITASRSGPARGVPQGAADGVAEPAGRGFYGLPGSDSQYHLSALFPALRRTLEQSPSEPWLLLPVRGPRGEAQLALAYRSGDDVRVLVSTPDVRRFVDELRTLLTEHVPKTRSVPWRGRSAESESPADGPRPLSVPRSFGALSTRSVAMASALDEIESVASSEIPVLLLGETGTGKDFAAREIHKASRRAGAPFIACNIGSISPHLIDSELFGHVKGAFTGATTDRSGLFREADGGSLFLDEIGDASSQTQTSLLRALETKSVRPVGTDRERPVDVRLITATSRDLDAAQKSGAFRKDLYYRLLGIAVHIPPLRRRLEDLPELAHHLLTQLCHDLGTPLPRLSSTALDELHARPWPGNIRELKTTLQAALLRARGADVLTLDHLSPPTRARIIKAEAIADSETPASTNVPVPFPATIVRLAQRSIREKAVCRTPEASRRVARASARAVALYLRLREPGELTGTLGRDARRLFQPNWAEADPQGPEALAHQLNDGAQSPVGVAELLEVLRGLGWG